MGSIVSIIQAALNLINAVAPAVGSSVSANAVIVPLQTILPIAITEAPNLVAEVKAVIGLLRAGGNLTADQITALQALDAQADSDFDAAAKDAGV